MSAAEARRGLLTMYVHLLLRGNIVTEGFTRPKELAFLMQLVRKRKPMLVGEVGFNAGFSSWAILQSYPKVKLVSFDLCAHRYVASAKRYLDKHFPGRHELVPGDSRESIPHYLSEHPRVRFDMVFIDGDHRYEVARADILNLRPLCGPDTIVVMDDVTPMRRWGKGPSKAWNEAVARGIVTQDALFEDGETANAPSWMGWHNWAVGRYVD